MLMNQIETALVNSAPRRWLQRWGETPQLRRLAGGRLPWGSRALELGCGPGYGTQLILEQFGARHVDAIDLDPTMVEQARSRLAPLAARTRVLLGDASSLPTELEPADGTYDAVFDFAIIHHIEDWRAALDEVTRVLRPGGLFLFDEVTALALASRTYRALFDHPTQDRFRPEDFLDALHERGLDPGGRYRTYRQGRYLLGVAAKVAPPAEP